MKIFTAAFLLYVSTVLWAQDPDTAKFDTDGTATIARTIPLPRGVSKEAQERLAKGLSWAPGPNQPEAKELIKKAREIYPVKEEEKTIAGVPVRFFTPPNIPASKKNRLLINLHGGGFTVDSGSYLESIPIASLTQTQVVTIYYTLAPVKPFPAAVDDVIAVYKELLKTYQPQNMALYGTSAGASLTAQSVARMKHDGLPLPRALGFFTGNADSSRPGDTQAFFAVPGLNGASVPQGGGNSAYLKGHDLKDPLASPIFSDLKGWPPVLCMTGTRDLFLSSTSNFHRALLKAGVDADLVVFEAMSHAHWYMIGIPEATEALQIQANWFDRKLEGK
jgi:acetyl esterase/lipase